MSESSRIGELESSKSSQLPHSVTLQLTNSRSETFGLAVQSNQGMEGLIWALIPIAGIVGGISLAIYKTAAMARVRELEVRERIAMIEKGLIPSPESNPRGFEKAMSAMARSADRNWYEDPQLRAFVLQRHYRRAERQRGAGITLIGIGFGLMLMLAYAADQPEQGLGIGGFIVLLGFAFFINSLFDRRERSRHDTFPGQPLPSQPPPLASETDPHLPPRS